ncbi:MAG: hypothetical protein K8S16_20925, partial [Bacteroidales bacterium]|nr:hypothetical protein [Bacteroidales bacterium]
AFLTGCSQLDANAAVPTENPNILRKSRRLDFTLFDISCSDKPLTENSVSGFFSTFGLSLLP